MKMSPEYEIQAHVRTRLVDVLDPATLTTVVSSQDTSTLNDVHTRIIDNVPDETLYPYIRFGQHIVDPDDSDCVDLSIHSLRIQVFSEKGGKSECKTICHLIKKALHEWVTEMTDNGLSTMYVDGIEYTDEPDGRRVQGVVKIEAHIEDRTE